jgi:hypothetical protein
MGLASAASSSCRLLSSCIGACLDFFAFGAGAVVRATETLFEFAPVLRLTAVDDFGIGTAFLFSEERDSKSNLNAASSVSSRIL